MPVDIFVIHENPEWLAPLAAALARRDACLVDWKEMKMVLKFVRREKKT